MWHAQTYIQLASEGKESKAEERASKEAALTGRRVCVYASKSAFGIVLGPFPKSEAPTLLMQFKQEQLVPADAIVALVDDRQLKRCFAPPSAAPPQ